MYNYKKYFNHKNRDKPTSSSLFFQFLQEIPFHFIPERIVMQFNNIYKAIANF